MCTAKGTTHTQPNRMYERKGGEVRARKERIGQGGNVGVMMMTRTEEKRRGGVRGGTETW